MKTEADVQRGNYFHYFKLAPSKAIDRLLYRQRLSAYERFMHHLQPGPDDTILDVGVSANTHISSNMLERQYPHTSRITGLSVDSFPELESEFPGFTFVQGDGRRLPFPHRSFDYVHSHAVIEHVGEQAKQVQFLEELLRVARKGVFVTTPNRWHPMEAHTGLPFVHWLPHHIHLALFRAIGKRMYCSLDQLNLLSRYHLGKIAQKANRGKWTVRLDGISWLGVDSNLLLVLARK